MISQVMHLHASREIFNHGGDAALIIKEPNFTWRSLYFVKFFE
jgi:hypothetical protein